MKSYTYLLIDLGCILIPFIASFYKAHAFKSTWPAFFKACSVVGLLFIIWDIIFTNLGIWGFNPNFLIGINFFNLPLEEILFFVCIPYACVFTYFSLKYLVPNINGQKKVRIIIIFLILTLSALAIIYHDRMYTFTTFSLTVLFLCYCLLNKIDLTYVFLSYVLILPFFFLSNGILTGILTTGPIVWYNDTENMGIRMFTIPVEDIIYGFLLIASINVIYAYFHDLKKTEN